MLMPKHIRAGVSLLRVLSALCLLCALCSAGGAVWFYWISSAQREYLQVDDPERDLALVPVGEKRFLEFRIRNTGRQTFYLNSILDELC